jgi:hypothetical protein
MPTRNKSRSAQRSAGGRATQAEQQPSPLAAVDEAYQQTYEQMEECIVRYPASSVLVALGAGFGLGIVLAGALGSRRVHRQRLPERIRRQVVDAVTATLPESLTQCLR